MIVGLEEARRKAIEEGDELRRQRSWLADYLRAIESLEANEDEIVEGEIDE